MRRAGLLALLFCSSARQVSSGAVVLSRQCFHEPFPASFDLSCSNLDEGVDLVSSIQHTSQNVFRNNSVGLPGGGKASVQTWSHAPICTQKLAGFNNEMCIYTNDKFLNGRGISILTTREMAAAIASHPTFQGVQTPESSGSSKEESWVTEQMPGKGIGVRAKKALKRGDRLTSFPPVLLIHPDIETFVSVADREKLLRIAVDQLPAQTKASFLSLATSFNDERIKIQDIIVTNSFQLFVAGQMQIAVVPEPARINHACNPNTIYHLDPTTMMHNVHVVRPIAPGEEITTTYADPVTPVAIRRPNLQNAFHFDCDCPRCRGEGKFQDSEARLERIQAVKGRLEDWSLKPEWSYRDELGAPRVELAEELIRMYKEEELDSHISTAYGIAALTASSMADKERALEFIELAMEALEMKEGPGGGADGVAMIELRDALLGRRDPHWSWAMRGDGL